VKDSDPLHMMTKLTNIKMLCLTVY